MPEETKLDPTPRLRERDFEALAPGSKLKLVLNEKGELRILGNRLGLKALTAISSGLSESAVRLAQRPQYTKLSLIGSPEYPDCRESESGDVVENKCR